MRFVSTGFHGLIDYLTAIALLAAPWLFGFSGYDLYATAVPVTLGATLLVISLFTSYELGMTRDGISMRTHLALDAIIGIVLMISPWALDFADEVFLPHVIIGGTELLFALITKARSGTELRRDNERNRLGGSRDSSRAAGSTTTGGSGTSTTGGTRKPL